MGLIQLVHNTPGKTGPDYQVCHRHFPYIYSEMLWDNKQSQYLYNTLMDTVGFIDGNNSKVVGEKWRFKIFFPRRTDSSFRGHEH